MICGMVNDNFLPALEELRQPQLRFRFILDSLLNYFEKEENNQNERSEDNQDEKEICIKLLEKIFPESDINQER